MAGRGDSAGQIEKRIRSDRPYARQKALLASGGIQRNVTPLISPVNILYITTDANNPCQERGTEMKNLCRAVMTH